MDKGYWGEITNLDEMIDPIDSDWEESDNWYLRNNLEYKDSL